MLEAERKVIVENFMKEKNISIEEFCDLCDITKPTFEVIMSKKFEEASLKDIYAFMRVLDKNSFTLFGVAYCSFGGWPYL